MNDNVNDIMNDNVNDIMNDNVNDKNGHNIVNDRFAHKPYSLLVALLVHFCLGYYVWYDIFTILFFRIIILALVLDNIIK